MEAWINDNSNALSSKQPRIVTRPDVKYALILWFRHMENKHKTMTRPMLWEKQKIFKDEFGVPEKERLSEEACVSSFCKAYKICEHQQHGEAGSVDSETVDAEQKYCCKILAKFTP